MVGILNTQQRRFAFGNGFFTLSNSSLSSRIIDKASRRVFPRLHLVYKKGQLAKQLFVLVQGEVELFVEKKVAPLNRDSAELQRVQCGIKPVELIKIEKGTVFGFEAMGFDRTEVYLCSAKVISTEALIYSLQSEEFAAILRSFGQQRANKLNKRATIFLTYLQSLLSQMDLPKSLQLEMSAYDEKIDRELRFKKPDPKIVFLKGIGHRIIDEKYEEWAIAHPGQCLSSRRKRKNTPSESPANRRTLQLFV
jgi:CRP-like cAMP-binding protein